MLPAEAYTSTEVLAWERRHLFAGELDLPGPRGRPAADDRAKPVTQRAVMVGDIACLLVRDASGELRMFANTCRHRGHELLPQDGDVAAAQHPVPVPRLDLRPRRRR